MRELPSVLLVVLFIFSSNASGQARVQTPARSQIQDPEVRKFEQEMSRYVRLQTLPPAQAAYYRDFSAQTGPAPISEYGQIFTVQTQATGIDAQNRQAQVTVRLRKIMSLGELRTILDLTKREISKRPFKSDEEEIQFFRDENIRKQAFFRDRARREEMDNDPDTPQGVSNILIWMTECNNSSAGLHFGDTHTLNIHGFASPGWWIASLEGPWFGGVPTDGWDRMYLRNNTTATIAVGYVKVLHSDYTILDKWYSPAYRLGKTTSVNKQMHLFRDVSNSKLEAMFAHGGGFLRSRDLASHAVVYYGAEEIGKIDGYKYAGHNKAWCSEFASWLLRRAGFGTPGGNIGVSDMESWFSSNGVLRTNVYGHRLTTGTYLNLWNKQHSSIFLEYIDQSPNLSNPNTQFRTIEGNAGKKVSLCTRKLSDISAFGYVP